MLWEQLRIIEKCQNWTKWKHDDKNEQNKGIKWQADDISFFLSCWNKVRSYPVPTSCPRKARNRMGARMFLAAVAERKPHDPDQANHVERPQVHELYQLAPGRWWQSGRSLWGHWNWCICTCFCHSQKSTTSTCYFSFVHWCLRRTMEPTRRQEMIGNADCWDSNIRQEWKIFDAPKNLWCCDTCHGSWWQ